MCRVKGRVQSEGACAECRGVCRVQGRVQSEGAALKLRDANRVLHAAISGRKTPLERELRFIMQDHGLKLWLNRH